MSYSPKPTSLVDCVARFSLATVSLLPIGCEKSDPQQQAQEETKVEPKKEISLEGILASPRTMEEILQRAPFALGPYGSLETWGPYKLITRQLEDKKVFISLEDETNGTKTSLGIVRGDLWWWTQDHLWIVPTHRHSDMKTSIIIEGDYYAELPQELLRAVSLKSKEEEFVISFPKDSLIQKMYFSLDKRRLLVQTWNRKDGKQRIAVAESGIWNEVNMNLDPGQMGNELAGWATNDAFLLVRGHDLYLRSISGDERQLTSVGASRSQWSPFYWDGDVFYVSAKKGGMAPRLRHIDIDTKEVYDVGPIQGGHTALILREPKFTGTRIKYKEPVAADSLDVAVVTELIRTKRQRARENIHEALLQEDRRKWTYFDGFRALFANIEDQPRLLEEFGGREAYENQIKMEFRAWRKLLVNLGEYRITEVSSVQNDDYFMRLKRIAPNLYLYDVGEKYSGSSDYRGVSKQLIIKTEKGLLLLPTMDLNKRFK